MDNFHEGQLALNHKVANSFKNFKAKGQAKMTRGNARARLEGLESAYSEIVLNHAKIVSLPNVSTDHQYFTDKVFDVTED